MNDPVRWLQDEDAPIESLELLRAARRPAPLSAAVRSRSRRRVVALSALPLAASFSFWPALAVGAALGTAGSLVLIGLSTSFEERPAAVVASSPSPRAVSDVVGAAESSAAAPAPAPAPAASDVPETAARVPVSRPLTAPAPSAVENSPPANPLDREIKLLEQARRASNPTAAHAVLIEHERSFPSGQLRVEREFLMVDVLVRLGRRSEAEARAAALEASAPRSLYGERLDKILGRAPR